jgi:hypothetical protein
MALLRTHGFLCSLSALLATHTTASLPSTMVPSTSDLTRVYGSCTTRKLTNALTTLLSTGDVLHCGVYPSVDGGRVVYG